jgi:hypothetical protein
MLKRKHEQSVIDSFFRHLSKVANQIGKKFVYCSLDGQDRFMGADYLLTDATKFTVTEFKYDESDIASEKNKPLPHEMCARLENEDNRQIEHKSCHFIAWSSGEIRRTVHFNQYSNEVCNRKVLGLLCGLNTGDPITGERINADVFIKQFLSGEIGLPFESFQSYITWLINNPDNDDGDGPQEFIELLLLDESRDDFVLIAFFSLLELKKWLDNNHPEPAMAFFAP